MLRILILCTLFINTIFADNLPIYVFPMNNYPQRIDAWVKVESGNRSLIDVKLQNKRFNDLKSHYFGINQDDQSPWSPYFIKQVLKGTESKNISNTEKYNISHYDNANNVESKIGYGFNFLPYKSQWSTRLSNNMNLSQFDNLQYSSSNRAIAVNKIEAYLVPTEDPWYYDYRVAGEGFPFNNNIISNVYLGTPLYVIGKSLDKRWLLVLTPQFIGWVKAAGIAYVSDSFISSWNKSVNNSLISIITPDVGLINSNNVLLNSASAGTILPAATINQTNFSVYVPQRGINGMAFSTTAFVSNNDAVLMPLLATEANIVKLINKLIGRPYGWGGYMGYNDCSAEMQAIFTPLGFYMPRNSGQQVNVGKVVDLSSYNATSRMNYVISHANAFMTLIQIQGHIMLYIGNSKFNNNLVPVIYEDAWGMRKIGENARYVIGKSVIFPLMLRYPESPLFISFFGNKIFKLSIMNVNAEYYNVLPILY
ncbi:MAG: SH3 domain-containing protein [Neisseriaceae bacterium]